MSPAVVIAFGFVWLALIVFAIALAVVAGRADEALERAEFDALVRERAAAAITAEDWRREAVVWEPGLRVVGSTATVYEFPQRNGDAA